MIKLIGIIIIVCCGAAGGISASEKLKRRREACTRLELAISQIAVMINHRELTFYEIVRELKAQQEINSLDFINGLPEEYDGVHSFSSLWLSSIENDNILGEEEKGFLRSFAATIGASDKSGQLSELEMLQSQLKAIEVKRTEEYYRKGKLYRSLGVLVGVMAGIIAV